MKRILLTAALAAASLAAATTAFAGEGYVTANVSLRAGPDAGYPAVMGLRAGTPVFIQGCVDGWSWCDVSLGDDRGWVSGAYLQEDYDGRRVYIRDYGVRIGIPIVSFVFGDYWDHYYRGRSWYGNRARYSHVQPHYYHSGGSYGHGGGSYAHGSTYHDSHHDSHPTYSGTHSGGYATHGVTQPGYHNQHTQSPSYGTQRHDVTHTQQQSHVQSAPVMHGAPQRSAGGHAAEAHTDRGSHGNNGGGHKDKDHKDGGGH
jgi:uncharacterized protein YraI